jgi:hypothetical protein
VRWISLRLQALTPQSPDVVAHALKDSTQAKAKSGFTVK